MDFALRSPAFEPGQQIPSQYTGDGTDVSPPLRWTGTPAGTRELALIVEDPDAPTPRPWVHWVLYKVNADTDTLPEGAGADQQPDDPAHTMQGLNGWNTIGYRGPAPPRGHGVHRYHFRLHALDQPINAATGMGVQGLRTAMAGHVIAEAELTGTYHR